LFNKLKEDKFTFGDFNSLENEDQKASVITFIKETKGNEGVLNFLKARLEDTQIVKHTESYTEELKLFKTSERYDWANDSKGNSGVQLAWVQFKCPSTDSYYMIEVCPSFSNVVEAAKWLRPKNVPSNLIYQWQSAN
jgi:hypothetical protein